MVRNTNSKDQAQLGETPNGDDMICPTPVDILVDKTGEDPKKVLSDWGQG